MPKYTKCEVCSESSRDSTLEKIKIDSKKYYYLCAQCYEREVFID